MGERHPAILPALIPIFLIGLICSLLIYLTDILTGERIEKNKQLAIVNILEEVMPLTHNNSLYTDKIVVPELSTTVYRARQDNDNIGLVFMPISASGYNGNITLAMGVSYEGIISGVRIIDHHETHGLGDGIDQNKSDWIFNFDKRSLTNTLNEQWAVVGDGGNFDQLSGATISPRAVIAAVKNTLNYHELNRDVLYK